MKIAGMNPSIFYRGYTSFLGSRADRREPSGRITTQIA
jgi:hypothetical protein